MGRRAPRRASAVGGRVRRGEKKEATQRVDEKKDVQEGEEIVVFEANQTNQFRGLAALGVVHSAVWLSYLDFAMQNDVVKSDQTTWQTIGLGFGTAALLIVMSRLFAHRSVKRLSVLKSGNQFRVTTYNLLGMAGKTRLHNVSSIEPTSTVNKSFHTIRMKTQKTLPYLLTKNAGKTKKIHKEALRHLMMGRTLKWTRKK